MASDNGLLPSWENTSVTENGIGRQMWKSKYGKRGKGQRVEQIKGDKVKYSDSLLFVKGERRKRTAKW